MSFPEVIVCQNWLEIDSRRLHADVLRDEPSRERRIVEPEQLDVILTLGRYAILDEIEYLYDRTKARNPTAIVSRPPIFVAHLGTDAQIEKVLTKKGLATTTNIHSDPKEIRKPFLDHWAAVHWNGFHPEIRTSLASHRDIDGSWLLLRRPELAQLVSTLGLQESEKMMAARHALTDATGMDRLHLLRYYREQGEEVVSTLKDKDEYTRAQIGLILACADLRGSANDADGFRHQIDDAVEYASEINPPLAQAIINAAWNRASE